MPRPVGKYFQPQKRLIELYRPFSPSQGVIILKNVTVWCVFLFVVYHNNLYCQIDTSFYNKQFTKYLIDINKLYAIVGDTSANNRALLAEQYSVLVGNSLKNIIQNTNTLKDSCLQNINIQYNKIFNMYTECTAQNDILKNRDTTLIATRLIKYIDSLRADSKEDTKTIISLQLQNKVLTDSIASFVKINKEYDIIIQGYKIDSINTLKEIELIKLKKENADTIVSLYKSKLPLFTIGLAAGSSFERNSNSGMLSAMFAWKIPVVEYICQLKKKDYTRKLTQNGYAVFPGTFPLLLNIPITDGLLSNSESTFNIFNKKSTVGLGIGYDIIQTSTGKQSLSVFYVYNFGENQQGANYIGIYFSLL